MDAKDFLPVPCTEANDVEQFAMKTFTKATRSLLAYRRREDTILSLHLKLYLTDTFLSDVGLLIGDTIDRGLLKDLDLTVLDETPPR
jgi:hypothetical protein